MGTCQLLRFSGRCNRTRGEYYEEGNTICGHECEALEFLIPSHCVVLHSDVLFLRMMMGRETHEERKTKGII